MILKSFIKPVGRSALELLALPLDAFMLAYRSMRATFGRCGGTHGVFSRSSGSTVRGRDLLSDVDRTVELSLIENC